MNFNIEFLTQVIIYLISLGTIFGKISSRMDQHDYKIDKLEENQHEKLLQLEKNQNEKIDRLEKKQDKHNQLIERMYKLEQNIAIFQTERDLLIDKINSLEREISDLHDSKNT